MTTVSKTKRSKHFLVFQAIKNAILLHNSYMKM